MENNILPIKSIVSIQRAKKKKTTRSKKIVYSTKTFAFKHTLEIDEYKMSFKKTLRTSGYALFDSLYDRKKSSHRTLDNFSTIDQRREKITKTKTNRAKRKKNEQKFVA